MSQNIILSLKDVSLRQIHKDYMVQNTPENDKYFIRMRYHS